MTRKLPTPAPAGAIKPPPPPAPPRRTPPLALTGEDVLRAFRVFNGWPLDMPLHETMLQDSLAVGLRRVLEDRALLARTATAPATSREDEALRRIGARALLRQVDPTLVPRDDDEHERLLARARALAGDADARGTA